MGYLSFSSDTQQSNTSERERNRNLGYWLVFLHYTNHSPLFWLAYFDPHLGISISNVSVSFSVECKTKSLSNPCVRFIMFPIFLAILIYNCYYKVTYFLSIYHLWGIEKGHLYTYQAHTNRPLYSLPETVDQNEFIPIYYISILANKFQIF